MPDHDELDRNTVDQGAESAFTPEVIEAIKEHMNSDHATESLVIVRALGGVPDAIGVQMSGMDADGIDFAVVTPFGGQDVRLPWRSRLTERGEVRSEVVAMYQRAAGETGAGH